MGVKDNFIYEKCMDALDATYGEKKKVKMRAKIAEIFTRFWRIGLITSSVKKEAQTYKEEREQQKREARKRTREKS